MIAWKQSYFRVALVLLCTVLLPASLAEAQEVPAPEEVFGFQPGADYKLADYDMMLEYYEQLDAASERVKVTQIGTSTMGRPMLLLFISSEENIDQLDRWRRISEQLARARIDSVKARRLAREGKAIVWIDGGMHATETAHAQMTSALAYRIATTETPEMQKIREKVILLLMPVMNPDGLHIVDAWYERVLGTPYETTSPPWLYQKYVGHDNNRDYYMYNMQETRAVGKGLYRTWYPQIVYNHHQSSPAWARIFVPRFSDPVNPRINPGVVAAVNEVGAAMMRRFAGKDMPGAISDVGYTMWWNGGGRTAPYYHNQIGILTETAHRTPTPRYYAPDSLPERVAGYPTDGTSISYPDPWLGGWSHLRDAVNYMLTASIAVLDFAADRKGELLMGIYQMGRDAIEKGKEGDPFAYVIPTEQWNEREATSLVNILRYGGVEVHRATQPFEAGGEEYEEGAYLIYAAQAFRPYVLSLLEEQDYPTRYKYPGGPPDPPYDLAGWTLPMQMSVTVDRINRAFEAQATEVKSMVEPIPGRVIGEASYGWILSHRSNASVEAVNRLLEEGARVYWAGAPVEVDGRQYNKGAYVIAGAQREQVEEFASEYGIDFRGLSAKPAVELYQLQRPRVGLYKSWVASIDEGWTRWLLQNYAFPVDTLHDAKIRHGYLSQYDAIILPDQSPETILHGHELGTMPPEYVGGLGLKGALALKRYVEAGGTVIAFDSASDFAIEQFGLPVRNVVEELPPEEFFISGSLIRVKVNTEHPLAYGMQEKVAAMFARGRAFEVVRPDRMGEGGWEKTVDLASAPPVEVVARYAEEDILMSGWALGGKEYIAGKPSMVRVRHGEGSVVLFGFRPQFRGQSRGTYKLIFNALHASTVDNLPQVGNVSASPRAAEE